LAVGVESGNSVAVTKADESDVVDESGVLDVSDIVDESCVVDVSNVVDESGVVLSGPLGSSAGFSKLLELEIKMTTYFDAAEAQRILMHVA